MLNRSSKWSFPFLSDSDTFHHIVTIATTAIFVTNMIVVHERRSWKPSKFLTMF